jgi:hypothetical protein
VPGPALRRPRRPRRFQPVTPRLLVTTLAGRVDELRPDGWTRVAVDGAPAAEPAALADRMAEELRERGRAVLRVHAGDFLRPASVRLEHGREDPDSYLDGWLDEAALHREVLAPLDREGTGEVLPRLWNPATDRSYRAGRVALAPWAVLLLDGPLLLGRGLPLELTVHLALSDGALARRTAPEDRWTLPAFDRYRRETDPERLADVVVRCDHPDHPAVGWGAGQRH